MKKTYLFVLFAFMISCSEEPGDLKDYYFFTEPDNIMLSVNQDSIAANGNDYAEISVQVSNTVMQRYSEIELEVSPLGKFINNSTRISVPFDGDGLAMAGIYSHEPGKTLVTAKIGPIKRIAEIVFYKDFSDSLKLLVTDNLVPADNYTYAEIKAITTSRQGMNNQIVFTTDNGLFSNNSNTYQVQVSSGDSTKVYLKNNKTGLARIVATFNNSFTEEAVINFGTSWPDRVIIDPDSSSLQPYITSNCVIKAKLLRQAGIVTEGQVINFYDSVGTISGGSIGTFLNTTIADNSGEATTEFWIQDTSFHGFVYIKGYVDTDAGKVMGFNRIYIQ